MGQVSFEKQLELGGKPGTRKQGAGATSAPPQARNLGWVVAFCWAPVNGCGEVKGYPPGIAEKEGNIVTGGMCFEEIRSSLQRGGRIIYK